VDDEPEAFPLELLRKDGFNVTHWLRVDSASLRELEQGAFDIIVLDIVGIADASVATNGGLGLLKHIKRVNPAQVVVAYSGQRFSVSDQEFFRLADETLAKPTDFVRVTEILDALLAEKFNLQHYWDGVSALLQEAGVSRAAIRGIEKDFVRALTRGQQQDTKGILQRVLHNPEAVVRVAGILSSLADLYLRLTPAK
jgi:DNA-binding NtrC family response regulator